MALSLLLMTPELLDGLVTYLAKRMGDAVVDAANERGLAALQSLGAGTLSGTLSGVLSGALADVLPAAAPSGEALQAPLRAQLGEALDALSLTLVRQDELAALRALAATVAAHGDTEAALQAWQQTQSQPESRASADPS
ncbi:hypothetical protein [Cupriavidus sp. TMH.W2]|uniref:hypothetical protein n=1 Tax=Cupriavidus sp. TMH.W2 TaxID=3434465 RepID=UPI003D76FDCB